MRTTIGVTSNAQSDAANRTSIGNAGSLQPTGTNIEDLLVEAKPAVAQRSTTVPTASTPAATKAGGHSGLGKKLVLISSGVAMLACAGILPGTTPAASAATLQYGNQYVSACYDSPYAQQDLGLMRHLASLSNSPQSGYNHAAGVYDGRANFTLHSLAKNRLDGDQAYNRLTCNLPVRLFSPQTGWLKFDNIPQLHEFIAQNGMPWDNPTAAYAPQYNDPWYDSGAIQYNNYDFSTYIFNNVPQYVAPPSNYAPPADWQQPGLIPGVPAWQQSPGNAAPIDNTPVVPVPIWQNGNAAPIDNTPVVPTWQNQAPADNAPVVLPWQGNPGNNAAPVDRAPVVPSWQQNQGNNTAPVDRAPVVPSWQQHSAPTTAPAWQTHSTAPAPSAGGAPVQKW